MDLTLDVAEVQVVVNYPGDPGGFNWHHRLLLCRVEGARWLTLTPDLEIQQEDLGVLRHRVLGRRAPYPADISAEIYAHDPISRAALNGYKRQAETMAIILGQGSLPESDAFVWVVADISRTDFGAEIEAHLLEDENTGLAFTSKGVILKDGEEVFVERVGLLQVEEWRKSRKLDQADLRLLGDHRDEAGKKRLDLSSALPLMKGNDDPEFPIMGTKAARELHEAVLEGSGNFITYHSEWIRLSGVSRRSGAAHNHAAICEALRLMHMYDQVDASALAVGEHLCRWLVQTEVAVERSPTAPDFTGLDILAGTATLQDGRAHTAKFNEWISGRLKERASIWKQERLYQQERKNQRAGRWGGGTGGDDESDSEDGKGKGKKKKSKKKKKNSKPEGEEPPSGSAHK